MADLPEIIGDIKLQLARGGMASVRTLSKAFAVNDTNRTGFFNFEEFTAILAKAGIFLKRQDATRVFRHFDVNGDERLSYAEFLRAIQGNVSSRRCNMIRQVFDSLDVNGSGRVALDTLRANYDAAKHPSVLSGEQTPDVAFTQFLNAFDGAGGRTGVLSWDDFLDYYSEISASVPYNDDLFCRLLEKTWNVTERSADSVSVPELVLRRVEAVLREKVRQRTSTSGSEQDTLRLVFQHFDLDETGCVSYAQFRRALERFGVVCDEGVSRALFAAFDTAGEGRIDYTEFVAVLYEDDVISASARSGGSTRARQAAADAAAVVGGDDGCGPPAARAGAPAAQATRRGRSPLATVVLVQGAPCSGKTTQCAAAAAALAGVRHLKVDDLLNDAAADASTEFGAFIRNCDANGAPLPVAFVADVICAAVANNTRDADATYLLNGFPNSRGSAAAFRAAAKGVSGCRIEVPFMLFLDADDGACAERAQAQGVAPDRFSARMQAFSENTVPLFEEFAARGQVRVLPASDDEAAVAGRVRAVLEELGGGMGLVARGDAPPADEGEAAF